MSAQIGRALISPPVSASAPRPHACPVEDPPTELAPLLQRFGALDSASVSDALDGLGLPSGVSGIGPVWGHPAIVGLAATVQLEPFVSGAAGAHIATSAVAEAGPTDVLVVATARGRLQQRATGVPVQVAAREVTPGDVVVADETGVVFAPRDRAAEVLADAEALARREQAIAADLRAGVPLPEAMRDSRLAGTEETSR